MSGSSSGTVLLTGASGFVGRSLWPALRQAGREVRCLTRDRERAERRWPGREWVEGDVADGDRLARALAGCDAAYYLVHGMADGGPGYREREVEAARRFAAAAAAAGVGRIVYLGGVAPRVRPSEHLRSRLEVGEALRAGPVPTLELRASMVVGHGSLSWLIVRDLAARLPFMLLPRWLRSRTEPVALDDVLAALAGALAIPLDRSEVADLPGPEALSGKEILGRAAAAIGLPHPVTVGVPVLSPWLSSHWVRFVTRAEWAVAREIVVGLTGDLLARDARFWDRIGHPERLPFAEAARRALAAERQEGPVPGFWGAVERRLARRARLRSAA